MQIFYFDNVMTQVKPEKVKKSVSIIKINKNENHEVKPGKTFTNMNRHIKICQREPQNDIFTCLRKNFRSSHSFVEKMRQCGYNCHYHLLGSRVFCFDRDDDSFFINLRGLQLQKNIYTQISFLWASNLNKHPWNLRTSEIIIVSQNIPFPF